ncbi:hypothetical protein BH11GEM1_BH11GEM1_29170 [soil metagenome]
MGTNHPSGNSQPNGAFSAELLSDIAVALADCLSASGAVQDAALRPLAHRVCIEARHLALPPEKMLIAVKHLFERLPPTPAPFEHRRQVFERFISTCIDDYFK